MDEPFGALDEQTRIKMGQELLRIWDASRKTVLFITHSLTEALFLSDVVLVMGRNPGRIIERMDVAFPRPAPDRAYGNARVRTVAQPAMEAARHGRRRA